MRSPIGLLLLLLVTACGQNDPPAQVAPEDDGGRIDTFLPSGCGEPAAGCPCPTPGKEIDCVIKRISGTYVSCELGKRTCGSDGRWGGCDGAATVWDGGTPNPDTSPGDVLHDTAPDTIFDSGSVLDTGPTDTVPTDSPSFDDVGATG